MWKQTSYIILFLLLFNFTTCEITSILSFDNNGCTFNFKEHPTDCEKFIQCLNGFEIEIQCPAFCTFDKNLKSCIYNAKGCTNLNNDATQVSSANPSNVDLNVLCKNISLEFLPYPGNCRRYIKCVNGLGSDRLCPGNLYFNSKFGVCSRTCV